MNPLYMPVALIAGIALAIMFYGGLWITIRKLPNARHPVLLTVGSFWLRTLVAVAGFLVIMRGNWKYAALCLAGFITGRVALSRYLAPRKVEIKCP